MKKLNFITILLISTAYFFSSCKGDEETTTVVKSDSKALTSLVVTDTGNNDLTGVISGNVVTFNNATVSGTNVGIIESIAFSPKAKSNKNTGDNLSLNDVITITAENDSSQNYSVTVNVMTGSGMTGISENPMLVINTITGATLTGNDIGDTFVTLTGNFVKIGNPNITALGILVTTNSGVNLELTDAGEAPMEARVISATSDELLVLKGLIAISPNNVPFSFPVTGLFANTMYYFRGYAEVSGAGIIYTNKIDLTTIPSVVRIGTITGADTYNK